jgi:hypothetical protein
MLQLGTYSKMNEYIYICSLFNYSYSKAQIIEREIKM